MAASTSSTPLLTNSGSNLRPVASNEEIIEPYLSRSLTWKQILQITLTSLSSFFMAQQTFISIFTDAKPTWHCIHPGDGTCDAGYNICQIPSDAWIWDKPAYTSIISEWSLQCAGNPIIAGLPASSFFMGCLLGGTILFFIGDSFERKKMLTLSCFVMSLAAFFTALSNNIWIYSALRFISGMGRAAVGTCGLVLAKEVVGKQWQGKVVTIGFFAFTSGYMALPAMAYCTQTYSWRVLYLLMSIPAILYSIVLHFFAYDSPRWLLAQGREQEAIAVLKSIAPSEAAEDLSWNFPTGSSANQDPNLKAKSKLSLLKILMEKRTFFRQRLLLSVIIASALGIVYYGMALGVNNLDFNLYWNVVFNASLQIPSNLLNLFTVSKWKRRSTLLALSVISGVCSILLCFMVGEWKGLQVGLELISFFCSNTAFLLLLIYAAELFPTYIRNSVVAVVWLALLLGGAISPLLISAGGDNKILSYGVFGVLIIIAGPLVIFLPETLGSTTFKDGDKDERERPETSL